MRIRTLVLHLCVIAIMLPALYRESNASATDPSALVAEVGRQLKEIVGNNSLTPIERQQRFRGVIDEAFDFSTISRFVLGGYWRGSSIALRQEFDHVFEDYVVQSMGGRFADYSGESMNVTAVRAGGGQSTVVSTAIVSADGAPPAKVDWRVQNTPAGFKITDVSVSGISMAISYRDQFAAVLDRDGGQISTLISDLRAKLVGQSTSPAAGGAATREAGP